jgi:pimeloyl-ACP methyl ester carboxylesterase
VRGHGRSDQPLEAEAYESRKHAEDFKAVVDVFRLSKPFVAGW